MFDNCDEGDAGNFRIVVRFLDDDAIEDEHAAENFPVTSREAAVWESPALQCRVAGAFTNESRRDATLATPRK